MPVTPKESFGLLQPQVQVRMAEADMLRVGMAGFQQALVENDQLQERVKQLETENAQLKGQVAPVQPPANTAAFPSRSPGIPVQ